MNIGGKRLYNTECMNKKNGSATIKNSIIKKYLGLSKLNEIMYTNLYRYWRI